jgi:phosphate transport system protein
MHTHTVKAFDEEIGDLRALIAQMGGMAEEAIRAAVVALRRHDLAGAAAIVAGDKAIDALEMEVEQLAIRIIALRAPAAVPEPETSGRGSFLVRPDVRTFLKSSSRASKLG